MKRTGKAVLLAGILVRSIAIASDITIADANQSEISSKDFAEFTKEIIQNNLDKIQILNSALLSTSINNHFITNCNEYTVPEINNLKSSLKRIDLEKLEDWKELNMRMTDIMKYSLIGCDYKSMQSIQGFHHKVNLVLELLSQYCIALKAIEHLGRELHDTFNYTTICTSEILHKSINNPRINNELKSKHERAIKAINNLKVLKPTQSFGNIDAFKAVPHKLCPEEPLTEEEMIKILEIPKSHGLICAERDQLMLIIRAQNFGGTKRKETFLEQSLIEEEMNKIFKNSEIYFFYTEMEELHCRKINQNPKPYSWIYITMENLYYKLLCAQLEDLKDLQDQLTLMIRPQSFVGAKRKETFLEQSLIEEEMNKIFKNSEIYFFYTAMEELPCQKINQNPKLDSVLYIRMEELYNQPINKIPKSHGSLITTTNYQSIHYVPLYTMQRLCNQEMLIIRAHQKLCNQPINKSRKINQNPKPDSWLQTTMEELHNQEMLIIRAQSFGGIDAFKDVHHKLFPEEPFDLE